MGLIISLILGVVLLFTATPFSVLAESQSPYTRPSLQDKTGDYAIVLSPKGCAAFIFNNGPDSYRYTCWDAEAKIFPDYDGYYRITLYTGFLDDSKLAYVHPDYKYDYVWKEHRKVYTNFAGCLRPYGDDWGIPETLGPCPPTPYPEGEPPIINPYSKRAEDRARTLQPLLNGINEYLIRPLLKDQSIIYPDSTGTDPQLVSNDDFEELEGLDELNAETPVPQSQF